MNDGFDERLPRWMRQFNDNHLALRKHLLQRLSDRSKTKQGEDDPEGEIVDRYCARTSVGDQDTFPNSDQELGWSRDSQPHSRRAWFSSAVPRVAASVGLAVVGGGLFLNNTSKPLYAIEAVIDRMRLFDSLYMRGTRLDGYPFEIYIERPYRFWVTYQDTIQLADEEVLISSGHHASDGAIRYVYEKFRNPDLTDIPPTLYRRSFAEFDLPIWSRIEAERLVLNILGGEEIFYRDASRFSLVGRAMCRGGNGQPCDLYEKTSHRGRFLQRLYVDPVNFVPVQVEEIQISDDGTEKLGWCIDEIELNPSAPPRHIKFHQFTEHQVEPAVKPFERFIPDHQKDFAFPFLLQVGTFCLCPWLSDYQDVQEEFHLVDRHGLIVPIVSQSLGTTFDGSKTWNWEMMKVPSDIAAPSIKISWTRPRQNRPNFRLDTTNPPVELSQFELAMVLEQMATAEQAKRIMAFLEQRWSAV